MRREDGLTTIGEIAGSVGVATSTLRYYEREGLLKPSGRSGAGYRLYDPASVERLRFIRTAQAVGFALDDIKALLALDAFLKRWNSAERKQAIIEELASEGLLLEPLAEEVGKDLDPFDLICHVAFDQPPPHPFASGERGLRRREFGEKLLHIERASPASMCRSFPTYSLVSAQMSSGRGARNYSRRPMDSSVSFLATWT